MTAAAVGAARGQPLNWSGTLTVSETEDLIGRCKIGDRNAFAALYRAYVPMVYRYVAGRVDRSKVEDFVAEAFVKALRNINRFEFRGVEFSAWLIRIARNLILDHAKSPAVTREILHDVTPEPRGIAGTESQVLAALDAEALRGALTRIRPEHRRVLELRFIQGRSGGETASIMGRTEGAVRVLQYRALQALRKELEETAPELISKLA